MDVTNTWIKTLFCLERNEIYKTWVRDISSRTKNGILALEEVRSAEISTFQVALISLLAECCYIPLPEESSCLSSPRGWSEEEPNNRTEIYTKSHTQTLVLGHGSLERIHQVLGWVSAEFLLFLTNDRDVQ